MVSRGPVNDTPVRLGHEPLWMRYAQDLNGVSALNGPARHTSFYVQEQPLTVAFYAYFDESGKWQDAKGYICLCGYVSNDDGWSAFNKHWNQLLRRHGFHYIHMSEFYSQCHKKHWDRQKSNSVLTDFIEAIRESDLVQFSVGLDGRYLNHKFTLSGKRKADPPLFAVQRALALIADAAKYWAGGRKVPLLFTF